MQVSELITKVTSNLQALGYTPRTAEYFKTTLNQFEKFCTAQGIIEYSVSLCDDFLHGYSKPGEVNSSFAAATLRRKKGILKMLDTFYSQGNWLKGRALQPQRLPPNFVDFLNAQDAALVKR